LPNLRAVRWRMGKPRMVKKAKKKEEKKPQPSA